jgi:DNA-binding MarR family transcriptional regulator
MTATESTPSKPLEGTATAAPQAGETRWLDAHEQQAWRAFLQSHVLLFAQLESELAGTAGVPMAYYEIMVQLSEAPDRQLRMSDLAAFSNQSRSRLSHAVARLEDLGWVERQACPTDRRGSYAVLTDQGFAALEATAPTHVTGVRVHLFDRLTPEQVDQMKAISEAVLEPLRRASSPAE